METQPTMQQEVQPTGCCPPFDPAPWSDREVEWHDKQFVQDHVHSFFHVPLDMTSKMKRNERLIRDAGAAPPAWLVLSDETSPWGSDIYIDVTKEVPGARMVALSGKFLTHVYEGPFRDAPRWAEDMGRRVAAQGRKLDKLYFAYTTCPRCAKVYGKNYVVVFARLAAPTVRSVVCEADVVV